VLGDVLILCVYSLIGLSAGAGKVRRPYYNRL